MKQQNAEMTNGVQIGNTLSIALQKPTPERKKIYLVLLAYSGVISSIFSFLTMFSPTYSLPVLMAAITGIFLFFCYSALGKKHNLLPVLGAVLVYCVLFFRQKERITNGLMYLTNHICQAIYMTDWEYFITDSSYTEINSVTCVLCFLIFPIIWMICYAVIRYQNFFLSFLVTFPFIEIGLFFGIVPNHLFAAMIAAFWFAMAAVQMAGSGITQNGGKTGFLRKKNAFLPTAGMRFMLPEYTGIMILTCIILLFLGTEVLLEKTGYERPEEIKNLRTDFQNYVASLHLTDNPLMENYGEAEELPEDDTNITLGSLEEKTYENIPVTSVAFSENPETRIYLKYRTGYVYNGRNWTVLPEEVYEDNALEAFNELNFYPPEFLYLTVPTELPVQMSLYHTTGILAQCVPYGFQKNRNILCQINDTIQTNTGSYTIQGRTDYEAFFAEPRNVKRVSLPDLYISTDVHDVWMSESNQLMSNFYNDELTGKAAEAGTLCGSFYDDFVYEHYLDLPNTSAMQAIRTAFAGELQNFNARTASPSETILKLQELRDSICSQVTYTLTPGKTPSDTDHTAYFLLTNRKGYCEHYATAGTILARMAGIPARYCEGYMIDCSRENTLTESKTEDGSIAYTSEILDSNAHAWTEIYLSGIGWIPFEFTFSYFTPRSIPEAPKAPVRETVPPTSPAIPAEAVTEPATELPVPGETEIPTGMLILIILLTIAAFCCMLILIFRIIRLTTVRKRQEQFNQEDRKAAGFCIYHYLTELLTECGVSTKGITIGEIVEESELHCSQYMPAVYSLSAAVQIGAKLRYSPHPMTKSELHYLHQTADALAEGMYQNAGFFRKFYLKWLRHYL